MCFSATASFSAAAVIGAIGAVTLTKAAKARHPAMLPYAAIPLLFASQQLIEGFLWLDLANPQAGECRGALIHGFVGFAEVLWPAFAPLAVWLIEPVVKRRRVLSVLAVCGSAVAAWLLYIMISLPYDATVQEAGIVYKNAYRPPLIVYMAYGFVTTLPFAVSSHREVRWFFFTIAAALVTTLIFYTRAYISVWCFFAALASALVYLHVARTQKTRLSNAQ